MTDRDVVERFAAVVGIGKVQPPRTFPANPHWKPFHEWYLNEAAEVRAVIALLLPYLGERRRAKALEVDAIAATIRCHNSKLTHCPDGHELAGDNLRLETIRRSSGVYQARRCKTCRQAQERERYLRKRAA